MKIKFKLFLFLLVSGLFSKDLPFYNESYAVIIGINNYQSEKFNNLAFAVEDARSISDLLINKLGYKVENVHLILDEEATRKNILTKLYHIAKNAQKKDRILIFYSGHGETIPFPTGGEVGYLVPVNAKPDDLIVTGISMEEFKKISDLTIANHVLYLVDACYSGIMTVGKGIQRKEFDNDEEYIKYVTSQPSKQIITAGGKDDEVIEKAIWGHSAFTKELLSGIEDGLADSGQDPDGYITAEELSLYLSKSVFITSDNNQKPIDGRYGSGEGEFVFINPSYIEEKADDVLVTSPLAMIDNSQTERGISEIQNTLNLLWERSNVGKESASTFDQEDQYLDSTFVYPHLRTPELKDAEFIFKYINPYYDIGKWRFSSLVAPFMHGNYTRVSGFDMGPSLEISQLKPIALKLEYYPSYNFSLSRFHHHASLTRYPWGNTKHETKIFYYDEITSNDYWMRDHTLNTISSWILGKDYQDHFHSKGYKLNYTYRLNDLISINTSYSNTYQKDMPVIKKYKNSIFKKAALNNRLNFNTAPYLFEDGRHTNVQAILTLNRLNTTIHKTITCTVELSDTSRNILDQPAPQVYLIPESKGWPNNQYEMKKPAFGIEKEVHYLLGGMVEVNLSNSTQDTTAAISKDSIYQVQYFYEVTVNLPPGSHAYRFLIDSIRYQIDDINEKAIIGDGKAVSIISIDTPYRFDIGYEFADTTLGGDFSYERLTFNYSTIHTLSNKDALLFRLIGGWSKKHLPVQKLFYIGGEGTVRGFQYLDTKKFSGRQMLLAKLEYHYFNNPLFEDMPLFLFYDIAVAGNKFNFNNPIISYGLGITSDIRRISDGESFDEFGVNIYKTKDSNNGNWGIEFIYNYFFNQIETDEYNRGFILP